MVLTALTKENYFSTIKTNKISNYISDYLSTNERSRDFSSYLSCLINKVEYLLLRFFLLRKSNALDLLSLMVLSINGTKDKFMSQTSALWRIFFNSTLDLHSLFYIPSLVFKDFFTSLRVSISNDLHQLSTKFLMSFDSLKRQFNNLLFYLTSRI